MVSGSLKVEVFYLLIESNDISGLHFDNLMQLIMLVLQFLKFIMKQSIFNLVW